MQFTMTTNAKTKGARKSLCYFKGWRTKPDNGGPPSFSAPCSRDQVSSIGCVQGRFKDKEREECRLESYTARGSGIVPLTFLHNNSKAIHASRNDKHCITTTQPKCELEKKARLKGKVRLKGDDPKEKSAKPENGTMTSSTRL